jgi:chorismate mutase
MPRAREPAASLSSLRHELEELDRAIVLLIAARLEVAVAAIRVRSAPKGSISDPAQEERVLARAQLWAVELGISGASMESIFRTIVEAGKARYARTMEGARSDSIPGVVTRSPGHRDRRSPAVTAPENEALAT